MSKALHFDQAPTMGSSHPAAVPLNFAEMDSPVLPSTQLNAVSMKQLQEKSNEDATRRKELQVVQTQIAMQESQIQKLEAEVRSLRVQSEREARESRRRLAANLQLLNEIKWQLKAPGNTQPIQEDSTSLEAALQDVLTLANQLQQDSQATAKLFSQARQRLLLITKERNALRDVIKAYESAVELGQVEEEDITDGDSGGALLDAPKQRSYSSGDPQIQELRSQVEQLTKQLRESEEACEVLEVQQERLHILGDYDPATTKVLHLRQNPADAAREKKLQLVKELTEENMRLREGLKTHSRNDHPRDATAPDKELEELRRQLASAELANERLKEAFHSTSSEFRLAVYQLLGFRIDITAPNRYKLMSMYAESPEDFLLFKRTSRGELHILSTKFSEELKDQVEHFLQTGNSIPAFLSSITMELFGRQTILAS